MNWIEAYCKYVTLFVLKFSLSLCSTFRPLSLIQIELWTGSMVESAENLEQHFETAIALQASLRRVKGKGREERERESRQSKRVLSKRLKSRLHSASGPEDRCPSLSVGLVAPDS